MYNSSIVFRCNGISKKHQHQYLLKTTIKIIWKHLLTSICNTSMNLQLYISIDILVLIYFQLQINAFSKANVKKTNNVGSSIKQLNPECLHSQSTINGMLVTYYLTDVFVWYFKSNKNSTFILFAECRILTE